MRLSIKNWFLSASFTSLLLSSSPGNVLFASASLSGVKSPSPPSASTATDATLSVGTTPPPFVHGKVFVNGIIQEVNKDKTILDHGLGEMELANVYGCCIQSSSSSSSESDQECSDNNNDKSTAATKQEQQLSPTIIGTLPQFNQQQSFHALQSAIQAWKGGSGTWPQMTLSQRITAIESFITNLQLKREEIISVLMWEIGKNFQDAEAEFDRTIAFIQKSIQFIRTSSEFSPKEWNDSHAPTKLYTSRSALGIVLCLGPYNYPLNETYATLIPALLMGNIILLKVPTVGGLVHQLTMEAFQNSLPKGTIQLISGSGRKTMPPLMESGKIDALAFIGGSKAADRLIKAHPEPHRLKLFLQLEAKNMGIYLPDLFHENNKNSEVVDWEKIMGETIAGTLSYNGQRCTALKLLFVPKDHARQFATMLAEKVEAMSIGLPWETTTTTTDGKNDKAKYSQITPLPNQARVSYMKELLSDAIDKGAAILNKDGGKIIGGSESSTLMVPAVLYPVTSDMRIYHEEQFGPIVPIVGYESLEEDVISYARDGKYGQQVSIFTSATTGASNHDTTSTTAKTTAKLIDQFSTIFGKININSQCGRSPDTAPFSGRRSSALGVMSVRDALIEFSIPTVVSYKDGGLEDLVKSVQDHSNFLQPL